MMVEKVMIQLKARGGCEGAAAPPMMIEKVMIQLGVLLIERGVAGGTREELAMLRMQGAKAKNPLGKQRMRKAKAAKSQKAKKPPAAAELAMQRMRKDKQNAEDAK